MRTERKDESKEGRKEGRDGQGEKGRKEEKEGGRKERREGGRKRERERKELRKKGGKKEGREGTMRKGWGRKKGRGKWGGRAAKGRQCPQFGGIRLTERREPRRGVKSSHRPSSEHRLLPVGTGPDTEHWQRGSWQGGRQQSF